MDNYARVRAYLEGYVKNISGKKEEELTEEEKNYREEIIKVLGSAGVLGAIDKAETEKDKFNIIEEFIEDAKKLDSYKEENAEQEESKEEEDLFSYFEKWDTNTLINKREEIAKAYPVMDGSVPADVAEQYKIICSIISQREPAAKKEEEPEIKPVENRPVEENVENQSVEPQKAVRQEEKKKDENKAQAAGSLGGPRKPKMIRIVKYVLTVAAVTAISALGFGAGFVPSLLVGTLASTAVATVDAIRDSAAEVKVEVTEEDGKEKTVEIKEIKEKEKDKDKSKEKDVSKEKEVKNDNNGINIDMFFKNLEKDKEVAKEKYDELVVDLKRVVSKIKDISDDQKAALVEHIVNTFNAFKVKELEEAKEVYEGFKDEEVLAAGKIVEDNDLKGFVSFIASSSLSDENKRKAIVDLKNTLYFVASLKGKDATLYDTNKFDAAAIRSALESSKEKVNFSDEKVASCFTDGVEYMKKGYEMKRIGAKKKEAKKLKNIFENKVKTVTANKEMSKSLAEKLKIRKANKRIKKQQEAEAQVNSINEDEELAETSSKVL